MWDPLKIDNRNHHDVYFCRYETRVDYIYCNENVLKEWLPVAVEHFDGDIDDPLWSVVSDHKAVIATLIKKSRK